MSAGVLIHWRLLSEVSLRIGASSPIAIDIAPTVSLATFGAAGHVGLSFRFADWCWGYVDGMVSVLDGVSRISEQVVVEGQFGVRFFFGGPGADDDVLVPLPAVY